MPREDESRRTCSLALSMRTLIAPRTFAVEGRDALGTTNWFQALWPSDCSMPEPKFPHLSVAPLRPSDPGVTIRRTNWNDTAHGHLAPVYHFIIEHNGMRRSLYSGGPGAAIIHRTGNLLCLVDSRDGLTIRFEMLVHSHFLALFRIRFHGQGDVMLRVDGEVQAQQPEEFGAGEGWRFRNGRGWHGVLLLPGAMDGEALALAAYDIPSLPELDAVLKDGRAKLARFDEQWQALSECQSIEPFVAGEETSQEKNIIAAFVNRALRNIRMGGLIRHPSMVEFYGPEWENGDGVWIAFLPACRYLLWMAPEVLAHSIRTLLEHQTPGGMVPQAVFPRTSYDYSQIPNITPCVRDYYVFTVDRAFLAYAYPRLKAWYAWWMRERNPTGDGIIAVGSSGQDLYSAICEYKDNGTDPSDPEEFENTCNPFTRTTGIAGRPERAYLPDIAACQARMAMDLAFFARELGLVNDASYFESEYRRVRDWVNEHLWDEATGFYYPVERATGRKVMKRTNTVFWLLWAGLVRDERAVKLIEALFDPRQFFTRIPVPMVALDDPSFNPRCGHWGDAYAWPLDAFIAFEGLLRYGAWDRAAVFARHYNRGVFSAIADTLQPAEFYHNEGFPCGCPIMGSAGLTPLVFQRYLRDHARGEARHAWRGFIPESLI